MSKKYDFEFVKESVEREGYKLVTDNYVNARSKLETVCPNGHVYCVSFDKWLQGRRCLCNHNRKVINDENIKMLCDEKCYTFIGIVTHGYIKYVKYICNNGHYNEVRIYHFRKGSGCSDCVGNKKLTIKFIKQSFESEGYTLLSSKYINSKAMLYYRCNNGHLNYMKWDNWSSGCRCPDCSGNKKLELSFVRNNVEKEGYKLLTNEYINCDQKLHLICPNGHDYYVSWDNWKYNKSRCTKCSNWGTSIQEKEIRDYLISNTQSCVIEHDRSLIYPYELDMVLPDLKIAIEYCGLYWHSEIAGKDRNYHLNKLTECTKKGYRLLTIFEDELVFKKEILESVLKNKIGIFDDTIIYARKCQVKEIDSVLSASFCEQNHLQGYSGSTIKLGLFYEDELVSVMTFSKQSIAKGRHHQKGYWELSRFCNKINYQITGGASKLLKYFESNFKPIRIISYADRRWSDGNLYNKLGFSFEKFTQPNYWYIKGQKRIYRFVLRKRPEEPKDRTEWELRQSDGYDRIWDCGNLRFIKNYIN